jgi:hypothetical protein
MASELQSPSRTFKKVILKRWMCEVNKIKQQQPSNNQIVGRHFWEHFTKATEAKMFGRVKEEESFCYLSLKKLICWYDFTQNVQNYDRFNDKDILLWKYFDYHFTSETLSFECEMQFLQFKTVWIITLILSHKLRHSELCVHCGQHLFRKPLILRDFVYGYRWIKL